MITKKELIVSFWMIKCSLDGYNSYIRYSKLKLVSSHYLLEAASFRFIGESPIIPGTKSHRNMNMIKWSEEAVSPNVLKAVHILFTSSPIVLRDKIEEECGWSTPTFYRKMKVSEALSNAERDKILQIAQEWVQYLQESCSNLAGGSKSN